MGYTFIGVKSPSLALRLASGSKGFLLGAVADGEFVCYHFLGI